MCYYDECAIRKKCVDNEDLNGKNFRISLNIENRLEDIVSNRIWEKKKIENGINGRMYSD